MTLTPPSMDQNANYDATAHNSWQINNSFQISIPILILCSSELRFQEILALASCHLDTYSL